MKKVIVSFFLCVSIFCWNQNALAQDFPILKSSLAFLPNILESPEKGVFVDLVKEIDKEYPGEIEIKVFPFPRSLNNIITAKADFHMPMIRNKLVSDDSLPYRYVSEIMGYVYFVIYSNRANPITLDKLKKAEKLNKFPYKIETMRGFKDYFPFPVIDSSQVASSLKKVNLRRADAFIFAQEESDYTVRTLGLKEIHREMYDKFDDVMVIPKGKRGKEIDKILSKYISRLKARGTWQKLHLKVHVPYIEWQPHIQLLNGTPKN
jgi:ABC-type amino acid transport substrate-binding protein